MIKPIILIMAYLIIGCLFAIATVAAFGEDFNDGEALVFAVLSVVFWPVMAVFAIVMFVLKLLS